MDMTDTELEALFQGRAFDEFKESQQARDKLLVGVNERLNVVISGLNNLAVRY